GQRPALQQQRRGDTHSRAGAERGALQPPGEATKGAQRAPRPRGDRAPVARADEATVAEEIIGHRVGRLARRALDRFQEVDRRRDPGGVGHASASGSPDKSGNSCTLPRSPYSSGRPERFTQKTRKPNTRAPNASHGFEETNAISSAAIPNRSVARRYTRGSGLYTPTASTLSTASSSPSTPAALTASASMDGSPLERIARPIPPARNRSSTSGTSG